MNVPKNLKRSNSLRTICEILREIQDLCQTDSDKDVEIRKKLLDSSILAKKMQWKLISYKKLFDEEWGKKNSEFIEKSKLDLEQYQMMEWDLLSDDEKNKRMKIRKSKSYKISDSK